MRTTKVTPVAERLERNLKTDENGCKVWAGHIMPNGYARINLGRRGVGGEYAHRVAYRIKHGAIPEGLEIDHTCRNKACANPDHLEAVTHRENSDRGLPFRKDKLIHKSDHEPRWLKNGTNSNGVKRRYCGICAKKKRDS